jgi:lipopolysaccharide biosynthesis glycosyltransferase
MSSNNYPIHRNRAVPQLYRGLNEHEQRYRNDRTTRRRRSIFLLILPILVFGIALRNYLLLVDMGFGYVDSSSSSSSILHIDTRSWCERVREARDALQLSFLHIKYPCETMKPATSAIVCMITDGATEERATRIVFTARDYINGAMALGASLKGNIYPSRTHQLLLLREGFELETDDVIRLESVGWTMGTAPNFPLEQEYLPKFKRYKTTYTKITAIGLSEYKCVMLMDADTLVVGDLREVMKCDTVFRNPKNNRVAGTIDWFQSSWKLFNTGSILWKTSSPEMERVFNLTRDTSLMKRYSSDQEFLNNVYPDRLNNKTFNNEIVALDTVESRSSSTSSGSSGKSSSSSNSIILKGLDPVIPHIEAQNGAVVPLSWDYNAQTHAEVQNSRFWDKHRSTTRIIHFTEKKGWQCEQRYDPIPKEIYPQHCQDKKRRKGKKKKKKKKIDPLCYCGEAHLYWIALQKAEKSYAVKSLTLSKANSVDKRRLEKKIV